MHGIAIARWIILSALLCGCAATAELPNVPNLPAPTHPIPSNDDDWISTLLDSDPRLEVMARNAADHRLQVLVSEVVEGKNGEPATLRRHGFRLDAEYFYPASAIKLFAALGAIEWIESFDSPAAPVTVSTPIRVHENQLIGLLDGKDASFRPGEVIDLEEVIRKLCIVSDNPAYNRLYGLVGPTPLTERAHRAGMSSVKVTHRLSDPRPSSSGHQTPRVELLVDEGPIEVPGAYCAPLPEIQIAPNSAVGNAHIASRQRREGPMDFAGKNAVSIADLQDALITTLRPDLAVGKRGYTLTPTGRETLATALRELPRQSRKPIYDPEHFPDDWVKFLLPGLRRVVPAGDLDVFAKAGLAYGFTVVNSCVVDRRSGRSFFVTACLYTNSNGTVNDGVYDYDTVAFPFWAALGEALAQTLFDDRVEGTSLFELEEWGTVADSP